MTEGINPFWSFWQTIPGHIDPVFFSVGFFQVRYYGLMYLVAFYAVYRLVVRRVNRESLPYTEESIQDYLLWAILGLLAGGRLGYVIFYNAGYYFANPLEIILPFDMSHGFRYVGISGMSYHGGFIGVLAATVIFCRKRKLDFWRFTDLIAGEIPLAYTFGRIGNFLNGELYGRVTDLPWGMYFPADPLGALRHPSQLYEALFEGVVLYAVICLLRKKASFSGYIFALYIMGYGVVRFFIEFTREPDPQMGFIFGPLTMGQVLCIGMIVVGGVIMAVRRNAVQPAALPKKIQKKKGD